MAVKKYIQIADTLEERIRSGVYSPESGLPTQKSLCEEFRTSRSNIHKVMSRLDSLGFIDRCRGRRTVPRGEAPGKTILFLFFSSIRKQQIEHSGIPGRLYAGMQRFAEEHRLTLLSQSGENFLANEGRLSFPVDGIILSGMHSDLYYARHLRKLGIPVCVIGPFHMLNLDMFSADYDEAGYRAAEALNRHELGRPILCRVQFRDEPLMTSIRKITDSFLEYVQYHPAMSPLCHTVVYEELEQGGASVRDLLSQIRDHQADSIVYCGCLPYKPLRHHAELQRLPSIVIDYLDAIEPEWNTESIGFDCARIGYLAAGRLNERIKNSEMEPQKVLIPCVESRKLFLKNPVNERRY